MKKLLILVAFATASATALAQTTTAPRTDTASHLYGELGYSMVDIEDDRLPGYSSDNDMLSAIIGYRFHPNVSGELFLGTGLSTQDEAYGGTTVRSKIDSSYGLFVRPSMMMSNQFEAFGRIGFLRNDLNVSGAGAAGSDSSTSAAYGVGVNWHFTPAMYGQLSYMSFHDKDETQADGYTLGLGMRF